MRQNITTAPELVSSIAFQPVLRPALPSVFNPPLEYRELRAQLERMDRILSEAKLDAVFLDFACKHQNIDLAKLSAKKALRFAAFTAMGLRANIARVFMGLAHRVFCARLADSSLLQWFLHIGEVSGVKVFAKSTSARFERWVGEQHLRSINDKLIALCSAPPAPAGPCAAFNLEAPVQCDEAFFDTTCVRTNMHFPVDWVLLRDAVRTLSKAMICIRNAGIKVRMPQGPEAFLCDMNKLCMAMSAQRRAQDSKKARKAILRQMKTLVNRIGTHARAHRDALAQRRSDTALSVGQARVIARRIDNVIGQLPAAIKQAHERIIGGRQVKNEDKIVSLYDADICIIVRGKAGAEVDRPAAAAA